MNATAFSRHNFTGKRTEKVTACLHFETKSDLDRKCHELGISASEYIAHLIEVTLYGSEHVLMVHQSRISGVFGSSQLVPTKGGL